MLALWTGDPSPHSWRAPLLARQNLAATLGHRGHLRRCDGSHDAKAQWPEQGDIVARVGLGHGHEHEQCRDDPGTTMGGYPRVIPSLFVYTPPPPLPETTEGKGKPRLPARLDRPRPRPRPRCFFLDTRTSIDLSTTQIPPMHMHMHIHTHTHTCMYACRLLPSPPPTLTSDGHANKTLIGYADGLRPRFRIGIYRQRYSFLRSLAHAS